MRRDRRRRHSEELGEPEMLPMMNVLFILVLVLMGMSTFMPLGAISTEAPRLAGAGEGPGGPTTNELNLVVMLQSDGINLSVRGSIQSGAAGPLIPKVQRNGALEYDFETLNQRLAQIKTENPGDNRVMIMADPDVIYDDIIKTMDASRRSRENKVMFPQVAFIPGIVD